MSRCNNETEWLPFSEEMFAVVDKNKLIFLYVDIALTVVIFLLFGEECHFVIKTYKHKDITVKVIWLVSIYPVFALSSLFSVIVPRSTNLCDFVSTCYLSGCLFQFSSLIVLYFGSPQQLLAKMQGSGFNLKTRPCCCCCPCCPVLPPSLKNFVTLRLMIFQTAVLMPIIQFVAAVLWVDGKYDKEGMDGTKAYTYLQFLKTASTLIALYGLSSLHQSTERHLRTHNTKPKMAVLSLVLLFFNLQGVLMDIPTRFNHPPERNGLSSHFQMNQWNHLVLVVEMFLLSLLARLLYRRPLELDAVLEAMPGAVEDIYTPDGDQNSPDGHKGSCDAAHTATDGHLPMKALPKTDVRADPANAQGSNDVCITVDSDAADGNVNHANGGNVNHAGIVNPVFEADTASGDK